MRLLVTGGAGPIGSVVVEELLAEVRAGAVLHNLSTGDGESVPQVSSRVVADVLDVDAVRRTPNVHGAETVVRAVPLACVHERVSIWSKSYCNDAGETLSLRGAMRAKRADALVVSSTSVMNGEARFPLNENRSVARLSPRNTKTSVAKGLIVQSEGQWMNARTRVSFSAATHTSRLEAALV